jgi:predicted MFS family arabinose efflux permease
VSSIFESSRTFRALRHRNYRLFVGGQLVSLVGTWLQSVAQAWLVYRLAGSALLLGVVGFSGQLPVLLLSPLGGAAADRLDRRRVLVATQSAAMLLALLLGALTVARAVTVPAVMAIAAALGVVNAFDMPTRQSFVIEMVSRDDLPNAIALNSSMVNAARMLGPAVAGVLVATVGEGWCFILNGLSYVAVILALLRIRVPPRARQVPASMRSHLAGGFRFAARSGPIRALLTLVGIVSLFGMPYAVLMPVFADRILGVGARGLGLLMGASGVGALCGALALARRRAVKGLGTWVVSAAGGFGLSLMLFGLSRRLSLSLPVLFLTGLTTVMQTAASNTLLQTLSPDDMRGRVMSLFSMMFLGMAPFGAFFAGAAAQHIGAPATVVVGGGICIVAALYFARRLPALRTEALALMAANEAGAGDPPDTVVGAELSPADSDQASPPETRAGP